MNRLGMIALCVGACSGAKEPAPAPYAYPFGSFTTDAHASAYSLCAGSLKVDTTPMPMTMARLRAPVDAVWESCESPPPERVSVLTQWDRGTNRIFWMSLGVNIPDAEFDQRLDQIVAKAFDPWVKVASHEQLVTAIKASAIIGTPNWNVRAHITREGVRPGWSFVLVDIGDTSADKAKADREAVKNL